MKKILLLTGFVLFSTVMVKAQDNPVHFGLEFGGNWSQLEHAAQSGFITYKKRLLYNAAVNVEFPFGENYSVSANVRYVRFGDKENISNNVTTTNNYGPGNEVYSKIDQHYLDLAIQLRYYTQDGYSGLYAVFGPEFGRLLGANYLYHDNQQTGADANGNTNTNIRKFMYPWNLLADAGLGYVFTGLKPQPYIQIIYSLGIIKTSKESFSNNKWTTRGLMFNVGVRF